ncbi:hypothetical protein [Bacteroides bouchesdurhonensis]
MYFTDLSDRVSVNKLHR